MEPSETPDRTEDREQLLVFESRVTSCMSLLAQHHTEMQQIDYDKDPKVLRRNLDQWLEWHQGASYWLIVAKQLRSEAKAAFRRAWQIVVSESSSYEMEQSLPFTGSYEERRVWYEMKVDHRQRDLDVLDRVVETVSEFKQALKTASDHWDKRRIDSKWEIDRAFRTPGSDYDSVPPTG